MVEIVSITIKPKGREAKLFFSDGTEMSINLLCVVKYNLTVGKTIDPVMLKEVVRETTNEAALTKALNFISVGMRTTKQLKDNLAKRFDPVAVDFAAEKLKEYGYLNDEEYAKQFVDYNSAAKGKRLLKQQMLEKGIARQTVEDALEEVDSEEEAAMQCATKFIKGREVDLKLLSQLNRHLISRGFSFDDINKILALFGKGNNVSLED